MAENSESKSKLFQFGPGFGNAVLNIGHSALDQFDLYAHAFYVAGQTLAEKMLSSSGYNDLDACPIVFLYRHALELYLKSLVVTGTKIHQLQGNEQPSHEQLLRSHRLVNFLPTIRNIFKEVGWDWDLDIEGLHTFEDFEELVREIDNVDPGSYTFRYPVDTQGQPSVPHHFVIAVPTFCRRMAALLDALEGGTLGMKATLEQMTEELAYYAQDKANYS